MPRNTSLIIDLQFGSTGKGLIAGYLAERNKPDTVMTAWAANAGHTYIDALGRKFVHTMLANGVVSPNLQRVLIGPGSILDLDNLYNEIMECRDLVGRALIVIHENAAVIEQRHRDEEAGPMTKIGSTKKGVGAAAIQRIRRNPDDMNTAKHAVPKHKIHDLVMVADVRQYNNFVDQAEEILIEGAQGYSLSMYHGFYPYCTSRDVSTAQLLADVGYPYGRGRLNIIGTARTFPIRVANRYDDKGNQVGWSGPAYEDQTETSFEELGQVTELTTVTKLPRRIFTFSKRQIYEAVRQNGVREIFLNFANYCRSDAELNQIISDIQSCGAEVRWLGYGPRSIDIREVV